MLERPGNHLGEPVITLPRLATTLVSLATTFPQAITTRRPLPGDHPHNANSLVNTWNWI